MTVYHALAQLKTMKYPLNIVQAQEFLDQYSSNTQSKLMAAILTGKSHIYMDKIGSEVTKSQDLLLLGIQGKDYAAIISEKIRNIIDLYIPALEKCSEASNFDLETI